MIAFEELRKILLLENVSDSMLGQDDSLFADARILAHGTLYFGRVMMRIFFYMLNEGKAVLEVDVSETISVSMGAIKTGFSFGWSALFPGSHYTATAVCVEPTEVISISGTDFLRLMDQDHDNGYEIKGKITAILRRRLARRTGQFLRAIEHHPDIQKLFQAEYEGPPEFFADIFLNSPIGIFIVQDGNFVFVNPEFQRITGYEESEIIGMNSLKMVAPR